MLGKLFEFLYKDNYVQLHTGNKISFSIIKFDNFVYENNTIIFKSSANGLIAVLDCAQIKDIEEILETYYNSNNFPLSIEYIIRNYYSESPFKFFEEFFEKFYSFFTGWIRNVDELFKSSVAQ